MKSANKESVGDLTKNKHSDHTTITANVATSTVSILNTHGRIQHFQYHSVKENISVDNNVDLKFSSNVHSEKYDNV